jgi:hypothetical protein
MLLGPFTQQQCRETIRLGKNSWWRTASEGLPYRREEKAPGSEGGRYIAKRQAEASVTKPQDRRTGETVLKVGHYKSERPDLWDREAAVQPSVELAITSRLF